MLQYTERFFQLCENNNFSEQMCKLMSTVNSEFFSFKGEGLSVKEGWVSFVAKGSDETMLGAGGRVNLKKEV